MARAGEALVDGCRRAGRVRSQFGGGGGCVSVRYVMDDVPVAFRLLPQSLGWQTRASLHRHLRERRLECLLGVAGETKHCCHCILRLRAMVM